MTEDEILALPYRPCVGIMIYNNEGNVFTGQRLDYRSDAWQMPQGGIEKNEDPKAAALRELEEETGILATSVTVIAQTKDWIPYELPYDLVPRLWKGRFRGQMQIWFLMKFNGDDSEINIATKEPEFSKWCWMDPSKLLSCIVPFKQKTYAQVIDEFENLIGK